MKIAILGAGAMGSLYGAFLGENGADVWLIDIWPEQVERLNKQGLVIEEGSNHKLYKVKATTEKEQIGPVDLILIFVKTYQTTEALRDISPLIHKQTIFMTLQNGLGNHELLAQRFGKSAVFAGTSSFGATLIEPGRIRIAGRGETVFGACNNNYRKEDLDKLFLLFEGSQLNPRLTEDALVQIWEKLLVNVGINALTAITNVPNGYLLKNDALLSLLEEAVTEAETVARKLKVTIAPNPVEKTKKIALLTGQNFSSMHQDLHKGRQTEIDAINGKVAELGSEIDLNTPVNKTLTLLIKAITEIKKK
ncbi:ketopantoate reductase family protein [Heliorestis acidaminivorans]|nr:ketopantoate reductase family protein [Heliorestis acidaminivorans]